MKRVEDSMKYYEKPAQRRANWKQRQDSRPRMNSSKIMLVKITGSGKLSIWEFKQLDLQGVGLRLVRVMSWYMNNSQTPIQGNCILREMMIKNPIFKVIIKDSIARLHIHYLYLTNNLALPLLINNKVRLNSNCPWRFHLLTSNLERGKIMIQILLRIITECEARNSKTCRTIK